MNRKKRILSWIAVACLVLSMFPAAVFAAWGHGNNGTADFTKILKGKDGKEYYINEDVKTVFYNKDGSKKIVDGNGRSKVRWRYLKINNKSDRNSQYGYCIEFGAGFNDTANYRATDSAKDKSFFLNLPTGAQKIIAAALCYGRIGSRKVPVTGANDADYYYATQALIWEAQQGLRTITTKGGKANGTRLAAAHGMPSSHMYKTLKGRTAERCYNWLLAKVNDHLKVHSFTAETVAAAPVYMMKFNKATGKWSLALTDANKKRNSIISKDPRVKITKSGYRYTLESQKPIETAALISCTNQITSGGSAGRILMWNCTTKPSNQAMVTGSLDMFPMYLKVRTEPQSQVLVTKKDRETDKAITGSAAAFQVKDRATGQIIAKDLKTGTNGSVMLPKKLHPGSYELKETQAPNGYRIDTKAIPFTIGSSGKPVTVVQKDLPQKGVIRLLKKGETFQAAAGKLETAEKPLAGVAFEILAAQDIVTNDKTVRLKKGAIADTMITGQEGNAKSKELYLGKYNIVEKEAPEGYIPLKEPILVELRFAGQEAILASAEASLTNRLETGDAEITKTDVSTGEPLPDTGIEILNEKKEVLLQTRSDAQGKAVFEKLPAGKYFFREFDAPKGYQIDETPYPFEIKEDGEIVKCEMTNQLIPQQPAQPETPSSIPEEPQPTQPEAPSTQPEQPQPTQPEKDTPQPKGQSPQTGDPFILWLCIAILVSAGIVIYLTVRRHRRY